MKKRNKFPRIVYKYRNWSIPRHRRILTHNELFLSSPKDFNDPFDTRIPPNFISLNTPEKKRAFVDRQTRTHLKMLSQKESDIEKKRLDDELNLDIWGFQQKYQDGWFQVHDERMGIISLSARWNSILMWSHYADNHQGFCIGFHEEKLRNSGLFARGGQVSYNRKDEMPFIDPLEDDHIIKAFIESHTKAHDWRYEREYRLIRTFYEGIPSDEDRAIRVPNDFIAEVILGMKINDEHRTRITKICQKKGIKVYQVEPVPFRFRLKKRLIRE